MSARRLDTGQIESQASRRSEEAIVRMDESEQAVEDRSGDLREHLPGDEDAEQREDRIPGEPADGDGRALGHETAEHGGAVQRREREGNERREGEREEDGAGG